MKITKTIIQDITYTGTSEQDYLNLTLEEKRGHIDGIYVSAEHRHNGVGTTLLKAVIKDADKRGWTLTLIVSASGDFDLNNQQLAKWYGRYGFIHTMKNKRNSRMKREPQA